MTLRPPDDRSDDERAADTASGMARDRGALDDAELHAMLMLLAESHIEVWKVLQSVCETVHGISAVAATMPEPPPVVGQIRELLTSMSEVDPFIANRAPQGDGST